MLCNDSTNTINSWPYTIGWLLSELRDWYC